MEQQPDLMPTLAEANVQPPPQEVPEEVREESTVEKIKRVDAMRESFPGEHWVVLGLGIAVWQFTRTNRHWLVRTAGSFAAASLVARAASGRDGVFKLLRYTPFGRSIRY